LDNYPSSIAYGSLALTLPVTSSPLLKHLQEEPEQLAPLFRI
jgi:hypothetical protein